MTRLSSRPKPIPTLGVVAILAALLGGCILSRSPADADSSSACDLPCWQGITPHHTPASEARSVLERLYGAERVSQTGEVITWEGEDGTSGHIAISDGVAGTIVLEYPEGALTVGALVEQIGAPAAVHITLPHPRHSPDPTNPQCDLLQLTYPNRKAEVRVYDSRTGEVQPEQSVYRIYLAPQRPELTIQTPYYARAWNGYGSYCIAVRDIFE